MTFDPTPASLDLHSGLFARFNEYLDWAELTWNEWVINYDFAHQTALAQNLQRDTRSWNEALHRWFARKQDIGREDVKAWVSRHDVWSIALPASLVLFLIVLRFRWIGAGLRRLRLFWQLRSAKSAGASPQLASRLYAELLHLLERRGFTRRVSQTPLEFAAAVDTPAFAPALREFTQIYTHARFGGVPCDTLRLRALLDQVRAASRPR